MLASFACTYLQSSIVEVEEKKLDEKDEYEFALKKKTDLETIFCYFRHEILHHLCLNLAPNPTDMIEKRGKNRKIVKHCQHIRRKTTTTDKNIKNHLAMVAALFSVDMMANDTMGKVTKTRKWTVKVDN